MAIATNTSHRTWQAYEQGERFPAGKIFKSLADMGFNTNWFFNDDPDVPMRTDAVPKVTQAGMAGNVPPELAVDDVNIQELLNMTARVLVSDTIYRPTLAANIKAFSRSIDMEQDNRELRNRVEKIEEKLRRMDQLLEVKEKSSPKEELSLDEKVA